MGEMDGRVEQLRTVVAELETRSSGTPHSLLGVSESASHSAILAAFVRLACRLHGGGLRSAEPHLRRRAHELYVRVRLAFDTIVATPDAISATCETRSSVFLARRFAS